MAGFVEQNPFLTFAYFLINTQHMKTFLRIALIPCFVVAFIFGSHAQTIEPVAELEIGSNVTGFQVHPTTGAQVVLTPKEILGLNPYSKEIMWRVNRSGMQAIADADTESSSDDFQPYLNTPYMFASKNIINSITGDVLVSEEKDGLKRSRGYYIMPEQEIVLVETINEKKIMLNAIGAFDSKLKWQAPIQEISGLGAGLSGNSGSETDTKIKPQLTEANQLIYQVKKDLVSINPDNGNVNWQEKVDPGYIFMNDDASKLIVAEKKGGFGLGLSAVEKFGKTIYSIDAAQGKSIWKKGVKLDGNVQFIIPHDGGVIVIHDEGANIYDYDDEKGEGRWKKDYKEKNIRRMEVEKAGLMFYTKNKRMLVDAKTGEEVWKKAEKLDKEPRVMRMGAVPQEKPEYVIADNSAIFEIKGKTVTIPANRYHMSEDKSHFLGVQYIYDEKGNFEYYALRVLDRASGKISFGKVDPKRNKGIKSFDFLEDDKLFVMTDKQFWLFKHGGEKMDLVKEEFYFEPGSLGRGLGRIALGAATTAVAVGGAVNATEQAIVSGDGSSIDRYNERMDTYGGTLDAANTAAARKDKSARTKQYAYFFSKNDDKDLVLFQVLKSTGESVGEYKFSDKTPKYKVDEENGYLYYGVDKKLQIFNLIGAE